MLNDDPSKLQKILLYTIAIIVLVLIGVLLPNKESAGSDITTEYNQPYVAAQHIPPDEPIEPVTQAPVASQEVSVVFPQSDYWEILDNYDWDLRMAHAILMCESHGKPWIVNDTPPDYSVGLMQINLYGKLKYSRPSEDWLKVPANNIDYAYHMWKNQGWGPWGCYTLKKDGKYLYQAYY